MLRLSCIVAALVCCSASTQSPQAIVHGDGLPGIELFRGEPTSTVWDPDGDGPEPTYWVVGGFIDRAGTVCVDGLAAWNPITETWLDIAGDTPGRREVRDFDVAPNGDLLVSGSLGDIYGSTLPHIGRRSTSGWSSLGVSSNGLQADRIDMIATAPNGDIIATGSFLDSTFDHRIARWNGSQWTALGSWWNFGQGTFSSLVVLPSGDVVVGGDFSQVYGAPTSFLARWDGATWCTIGGGVAGRVNDMAIMPNGDLAVVGEFTVVAGSLPANRIAFWNGSSWSTAGSGTDSSVYAIAVRPDGSVIVSGYFNSAGGVPTNRIAEWDGSTWSPLGLGIDRPATTIDVLPSGEVAAAGSFSVAGGRGAVSAAVWNGIEWRATSPGFSGPVGAMTSLPNGDLVVAGPFHVGSICSVARWDGANWYPLGTNPPHDVRALATLPNGDVVAGGGFLTAAGAVADGIAKWDGATWSALGSGMTAPVRALAVAANGDVFAAGDFTTAGGVAVQHLARWDGTAWHDVGGGTNAPPLALAVMPGGELIAGGGFSSVAGTPTGLIASWDGTSWSSLGGGVGYTVGGPGWVATLAVGPSGELVVGGDFDSAGGAPANHVAMWNQQAWTPLGAGQEWSYVSSAHFTSNGQLVVAGWSTTGHVARWNGSGWAPFTGGLEFPCCYNAVAMANGPGGELAIGGDFTSVHGRVIEHFARIELFGAVSSSGSGCAGQLGAPLLAVPGLYPRVGDPFTLQILNAMPNSATWFAIGLDRLAGHDLGLIGMPGCQLWSAPLVTIPATANASGSAIATLTVPARGMNAGLDFTCQGFVHEPGANALGVILTNGLHSQIAP